MNGWKRLFVVLAAIVVVPALGFWLSSKPDQDGKFYAPGCYESGISYVTAKDSDAYLRTAPGISFECKRSLAFIASGKQFTQDRDRWMKSLYDGAKAITLLLAVLYALGWATGWIWRGFFPKRTP